MSLQVWLPLNGDIKNLGLDNITFTRNTGAVINNNGKIGKCYSFNGTDDWVQYGIDKTKYSGKPISIACWFKSDLTKSTGVIIDIGADLCLGYSYTSSTVKFYYWRVYGTSSSRSGDTRTTAGSWDATQWHHCVIVCDKTINLIYVDGILAGEWASASQEYWSALLGASYNLLSIGKSAGSTSWTGGMVNDIRVYDHALSAKEVEEISKGLVLHYKLDDIYSESTTNLFYPTLDTSCNSLTGFSANQNVNLSLDNINTISAIKAISNLNTSTPGIKLGTYSVTANTTYTVSCLMESNCVSCLSAYQISSSLQTVKTIGEKVSVTFNSGSSTSITFYAFMIVPLTGQYIKIALPLLEQKDHASGFTLNARTGIIYDSSGYENNGIITGNVQTDENTVRYSCSMKQANGQYIRVQKRPVECMPKDAITVNIWQYATPWGNPISCTEGGGWNFENSSGIRFPIYISGVGYKVALSSITPASTLNAWHMLTGTMNKDNIKIYYDGLEVGTIATGSTNGIGYANNYIFIGGEASGNQLTPANSTYAGNLSDIRIYATALTPNLIKELYNTSATIDNFGNVYAREMVE